MILVSKSGGVVPLLHRQTAGSMLNSSAFAGAHLRGNRECQTSAGTAMRRSSSGGSTGVFGHSMSPATGVQGIPQAPLVGQSLLPSPDRPDRRASQLQRAGPWDMLAVTWASRLRIQLSAQSAVQGSSSTRMAMGTAFSLIAWVSRGQSTRACRQTTPSAQPPAVTL